MLSRYLLVGNACQCRTLESARLKPSKSVTSLKHSMYRTLSNRPKTLARLSEVSKSGCDLKSIRDTSQKLDSVDAKSEDRGLHEAAYETLKVTCFISLLVVF